METAADWPLWLWALYGVGGVYFGLFLVYFLHFRALERRARLGDPVDVARHNRALRGVPAAFYSKMLGRRPL